MWDVLIIILVCPLLGGMPLISWITYGLTGQYLARLGTRNVSVSAAFYHGGQVAGILAIASEAFKGIAAVLLARFLFPGQPVWELVALIALVIGRYGLSRGAGTTNVVWGYIVHDWVSAGLLFLISGIGFTLLRERRLGRLSVLVLLPLLTILRYPHSGGRLLAIIVLSLLLAWIYQVIPDDLDLPANSAQGQSQKMFRFFRGDRAILSLDQVLHSDRVGQKSATLAYLKRQGYPVPMGWVLPPGDDPTPLIEALRLTAEQPLVVRSSAIGEDGNQASAAGLYESILSVTSAAALEQAIAHCQLSYNRSVAVQYRRDRQVEEGGMAVLVQNQVQGVFSGVAFSRDPITRHGDAVVIEALPGAASRVVSGRVTPEQYRVWISGYEVASDWQLPETVTFPLEGEGDVPPRLIQQVAHFARHLEQRYQGVPQDIEWSYDGQQLWLLQCRPITTLLPIWTRKIAAEVIPGLIRPLTWSINRPLTCGVWGEIFTLVLGDRARGLDFNETATLYHSSAYFNASLLGQIFLRMGLPPESLEFLTRGAKFSKPPLTSTLRNLPGLMRLLKRELALEKDFYQDNQEQFEPVLAALDRQPTSTLSPSQLLERIDQILDVLKRATYYSILAPLSLSLRQAILKVNDTELDNCHAPEVEALRSLQALAIAARPLIPNLEQLSSQPSTLFAALAETPDGQTVLRQLDQFLDQYGYLSEVGTDIAVPTWKEDPKSVRDLFAQYLFNPISPESTPLPPQRGATKRVQRRLNLKGQVTAVYSRLLAELRWSIIALEHCWLTANLLTTPGDIFFLTFDEIRQVLITENGELTDSLKPLVVMRRSQLDQDCQLTPVPPLVYGTDPPVLTINNARSLSHRPSSRQLQGIGASPGRIEGRVLILQTVQDAPSIDQDTILVVPYTDSGWALLLAQAGGLIAEVGGRLSHGAIVAREYGIPAVMDIHNAMQQLRNGQQVRLDGERGTVEIL